VGKEKTSLKKNVKRISCNTFRSAELQSNYNYNIVRPEVLTAVTMKTSIFWDITPCIPVSEDDTTSIFRVNE
jgi:hypothetical protein